VTYVAPPWSVTDDDRRRRQAPASKTILAPLCVGGQVIIKHVVKSRLIDHLSSSKLLHSHQSAYCKHHSTETALLYIHDHLINGSQKVSCLCLLDLSAAFDTIDHNILITRLSSIQLPISSSSFDSPLCSSITSSLFHSRLAKICNLTGHIPLCPKYCLYLWRTHSLTKLHLSPKPVTRVSHSSTSLYPALLWLVNCLYHCYLYRSLQPWWIKRGKGDGWRNR